MMSISTNTPGAGVGVKRYMGSFNSPYQNGGNFGPVNDNPACASCNYA